VFKQCANANIYLIRGVKGRLRTKNTLGSSTVFIA